MGDIGGQSRRGEEILFSGIVKVFVDVRDIVFDSSGLIILGLKPKFEAGEDLVNLFGGGHGRFWFGLGGQ